MCTTCAVSWQEREQSRFDDGTYKAVPIALTYPVEHYLHLSVTESEGDTVAYTPSVEYGERDRQVRLKFGRYLKKVWPGMTDAYVQAHVTALKSALLIAISAPVLKFATDRETVNKIFETEMYACGSSQVSCMHGKFDGDAIRPYHVYCDSPDVAVAYVVADGAIVSRSVVSVKDKAWVRTYSLAGGDNDADCGTLKVMLKDAGYSKGDLFGNRLTKLDTDSVMLPYIDNSGAYVRDGGKYWIVQEDEDDADWKAENTDGTAESCERCRVCEEPTDECECIWCDCCSENYRHGCDTCNMCESCELCVEHDKCSCERCSECSRLLEGGRHTTVCRCWRCSECGSLEDDCEDESETEDESAPVVVPDLVMTPREVREKLNRVWVYLRDHGERDGAHLNERLSMFNQSNAMVLVRTAFDEAQGWGIH